MNEGQDVSLTTLESFVDSAYLDFEITGINAVQSSMNPGIMGLLVRDDYICLVLDEKLSSLAEIFPRYCVFDSEMDYVTCIQDWLVEVDEDGDTIWTWTWSERDIEWFSQHIGAFSDVGLKPVNAIQWVKKHGRARGLRNPHSLEKYMSEVGHKFPKVGYASKLIQSLREYDTLKKTVDDRFRKTAFDLLIYNYHDCYGMREVMLDMHGYQSPFSPIDEFRVEE